LTWKQAKEKVVHVHERKKPRKQYVYLNLHKFIQTQLCDL